MRHLLAGRTILNMIFLLISQYLSFLYFIVIYPKEDALSLNPPMAFIHVFIEWCAVALLYNILWGRSRFTSFICHLFALQVLLVQTTQFLSLYNSQDYINSIALAHAGLVGLLITKKTILLCVLSLFVPLLAIFLTTKLAKPKLRPLNFKKRFSLVAANLLLLAIIIVVKNNALAFKLTKFSYPANRDSMVAAFYKEVGKYGKVTEVVEPEIVLNDEEYKVLEEHGLFINRDTDYPLIKDFIYQKELPFLKNPENQEKNLNMIVIFTESLNARMLENYNPKRKGLTPNIAKFASEALQVENYLNHAFPTIVGLRGQLCSIFPTLDNAVWNKGRSRAQTAKNKCMPAILQKNGYETIYLGYSHPNETFFNDQMQEFGFEKRYFYDDLLERFCPQMPDPARGHYGNSDEQMFNSLMAFLESYDEDKNFFLAMSTIETHPGMDVLNPEEYSSKFNGPILRITHNFDQQFGRFWEYFKNSKYKDNTIVVLTADHAHVPNIEYMSIAGENYNRDNYFDPVPLVIYDPTRLLPKHFVSNGTSIDFAPTMLQLLDIPNERNHFLGLSLFSDRPEKKGGLGIVTKSRFLINNKGSYEINNLSLKKCSPDITNEMCILYRGVRFTQNLCEKNRLYQ